MSLADFIDNQAAGGELQSSGAFTIDFARAREKLIQFALPLPTHYLFKLVQFANLAGCRRLECVVKNRRVEMYFHGGDAQAAPLREVHTNLLRPLSSEEGAMAALLIGLNGALALKPKSLVLSDGQGRQLSISEKGADLEEPEGEEEERVEVSEGWNYSVVLQRAGSRKVAKAEKEGLTQNCAFGEVELLLNGKPLAPAVPDLRQSGKPVYLPDEFLLCERRIAEAGGMCLPEWPEEGGDARDPRRRVFLRQLRGESRVSRFSHWIFLRYGRPPLSRIMIVQHGVWVDTVEENLDVSGLEAVVNAPRLKTDLTGLQIQRSPELEKLVSFIKSQGLELCAAVKEHRSTLYAVVPPEGQEDRSGAGCFGCLVGCPASAMFFVLVANLVPQAWYSVGMDIWMGLAGMVVGGFVTSYAVKRFLLRTRMLSYRDWDPLDKELRRQLDGRLAGVLKKHQLPVPE